MDNVAGQYIIKGLKGHELDTLRTHMFKTHRIESEWGGDNNSELHMYIRDRSEYGNLVEAIVLRLGKVNAQRYIHQR